MMSFPEPPTIVSLPKPPMITSGRLEPEALTMSLSLSTGVECATGSPVAEPPEVSSTKNPSLPVVRFTVTVSLPRPVSRIVVVRSAPSGNVPSTNTVSAPEPVQ